ncbi:MAG: hypothetical protein LBV23_08015 [Deltaproteobacteria bacterium]|jgi:hypothetical protein|nr:hypothetical protein [Deltaproteobacteria bacterium]
MVISIYRFSSKIIMFLAIIMVASSCAPRYEFRAVPMRPIEGYPNRVSFPEGSTGAYAYYESAELIKVFGFDLKKAGVIPIELRVENDGAKSPIVLVEAALTDQSGQMWAVLPSDVVYRRIDDHTSGGLSASDGARRTLLWGLAGAAVGAAVGVVGGSSVAEATAKGAAAGAGLGVASSVIESGLDDEDKSNDVYRDFSKRSVEHLVVAPGDSTNGLLYFPAEASRPAKLNLKLRIGSTTRKVSLRL